MISRAKLSRIKAEVGRKGGMATYAREGREGMSARGKAGGRPRSLTLDELAQLGPDLLLQLPLRGLALAPDQFDKFLCPRVAVL